MLGRIFLCVNPDQSVFLSLGRTKYFANNTPIVMTSIGSTNSTALNCHTDSSTCCKGVHNPDGYMGMGEWVFPDGSRIAQNSNHGDEFYWIRYHKVVRLYRRGKIEASLGSYCCRVPDSYGAMRTFCANLVGKTYSVS